MKKRYIIFSLFVILALLIFRFYLKPMLLIYAGYSAKTACSCHFIQNRTLEDIVEDELSLASFIKTSIQHELKSVESTFLGISRTAIYRPEMGCTLLSERNEHDIRQLAIPKSSKNNIERLKTSQEFIPGLQTIVDKAFEEKFDKAVNTRAILIYKDSLILAEQYADGYTDITPQMGWSMTKSITNALIGILVKNGQLDIFNPAPISDWFVQNDDPRQSITLDHLLRMSSGLNFEEAYDKNSTVNQMLWTKADAAKVAYSQSLHKAIDTKWFYSSGTTNIISHVIRNQFATYQDYINFPYEALFNKLGMNSTIMETDPNGTYVGSSLMYASARDWAKFGILFLQDGVWNGERILPEGWVDYSTTPSLTTSPYDFYGAHFWLNAVEEPPKNTEVPRKWPGVPDDAYYASGFEGQTVLIIPSENMVIVRLGQTLDRSVWDMGAFAAEVLAVLK